MAWWHFGKKKRQNKQSSSAPQKGGLDEKRTKVSSSKDVTSQTISPRPPDEPIGAAPYELQREGTPPILTEEPVRSLPTSPKSPKSHNRNISDASSSQGRTEPVPQTPPQYPSQIQSQGLSQVVEQDLEQEPLLEQPNGDVPETAPQSEYPEAPIDVYDEATQVYPRKRSLVTPAEFLLDAPQGFTTRGTAKSPPKSPVRPTRRSSIEDITALPAAPKTLERSPHLRPVPESDANVRAGTSVGNRATSKKKSTRRRKEDAVREKEVRAMTEPLPQVKRVVTNPSEVFRRDSKRMRDDLNKPIDPASTTSVQRPGSARSSVTGMSDAHRLAVGFVDILAPRPRMRYSMQGPYEVSSLRSPSRADSKREFPSIPRGTLEEEKKIDELADEMDTGSLRELMDRDQRRREKKRRAEQDRARRRLERLAARGEKDAETKLNQLPPPVPPLPSTVEDTPGPSGVAREYPRDVHPALRDPSPIPEDVDATDTTADPFKDPEEMEPVSAIQETETLEKSPFDDPSNELVEDVQPSQEHVPADDSIQVSPVEDTQLDTQQVQEKDTAADSIQASPVDDAPKDLLPQTTEPRSLSLEDNNEQPEVDRRISQSSARRSGGIVGLFRRSLIGKRDSTASGSEEPSKRPYSMSSRESMSRRGPVENNHERTYRRSSTGVPVRTASKFKENLPDAPALPGGSATQNAPEAAFTTMPSAEEFAAVESTNIEELPAEEPEPESLGSVDAEGSWLSGRPGKRASQQASLGRSSLVQQPALTTSMEEIKTPATEAYVTPTEESPVQFSPISSPAFEPQQGQSTAPPVEEAEGQVIRRTPKVVQVEPRVQSTVGLLQVADDDDLDSSSGDDHVEVYQVEEAIAADSVTRQASHARQISAGSARLFEVPSKRDSQPPLPTSET